MKSNEEIVKVAKENFSNITAHLSGEEINRLFFLAALGIEKIRTVKFNSGAKHFDDVNFYEEDERQ